MRKNVTVFALVVSLLFSLSGCQNHDTTTKEDTEVTQEQATQEEVVPKETDDFYHAVNAEQLKKWEIPEDQPSISWFDNAAEENYKKLDAVIKQIAQKENPIGSDAYNIASLYETGLDQDTRNNGGCGVMNPYMTQIEKATSVKELISINMEINRKTGFSSLMGVSIYADAKDSNKNTLYLNGMDTGLLKEEWFSDDQTQAQAYEKLLKQLAMLNQESENDVEKIIDMMKSIADVSLKMEEQYDAAKTYNVYHVSDLADLFKNQLSMEEFCQLYEVSQSDSIIINDVKALKKSVEYLKEENLDILKMYMKMIIYKDLASYVDIDSYNAKEEYKVAVTGQTKDVSFARNVSEDVQSALGFECGKLYCEQYFSEESKVDVQKMVEEIIQVYKQRIEALDWMSEKTKKEACKKLNTMDIRIGYPEQWPQDKYKLTLTPLKEGGLYVNNIIAIQQAKQDYLFKTKGDPVDRSVWPDTPQTVNAYYDPSNNSISLLAGILQAPFYDKNATAEENLGGIGMVIAHEITHAFDTSGAQYDEKGNVNNWWTKKDLEKFNELAQTVIDYYSTFEVNGIKVNGEQTVTENIADLGAMNCITEIAQKKGYDIKNVYTAYAKMWATKMRDEYQSYLLKVDVHSPNEVRVNAVLSSIEQFYKAYDVKEGDGMYQKSEDRPSIW